MLTVPCAGAGRSTEDGELLEEDLFNLSDGGAPPSPPSSPGDALTDSDDDFPHNEGEARSKVMRIRQCSGHRRELLLN